MCQKPLSPKPGVLSYPFTTPPHLSFRWIGANKAGDIPAIAPSRPVFARANIAVMRTKSAVSEVTAPANGSITEASSTVPRARAAADRTESSKSDPRERVSGSVTNVTGSGAFLLKRAKSSAASIRRLGYGSVKRIADNLASSASQTSLEPAPDSGPSGPVGSNPIHPRASNPTYAHWWAWSEATGCSTPTCAIVQPEATLAGTPTDRANKTKALLNCPAVPSR